MEPSDARMAVRLHLLFRQGAPVRAQQQRDDAVEALIGRGRGRRGEDDGGGDEEQRHLVLVERPERVARRLLLVRDAVDHARRQRVAEGLERLHPLLRVLEVRLKERLVGEHLLRARCVAITSIVFASSMALSLL